MRVHFSQGKMTERESHLPLEVQLQLTDDGCAIGQRGHS
jgi:hypothetical protein